MKQRHDDSRPGEERIGVLILGMHRSGTSALARVLSLLGCDLPKTLIGPDISNEAGHWESTPVARLNDEILSSGGSNWHDWLPFNPGWIASPKAIEFRTKAAAVLEAEFGSSSLFVLKDPRISRLTPFWLDVFRSAGVRPAVIMPLRNPLEVAGSLASRNGIDPALGHLLWLRHVLEAEAATRGMARFHTSYDALLAGWPKVMADAGAALGISWPRMSPLVAKEIDAFLSDRLRHHAEQPKSLSDNPLLSGWLRDSFAIFSRWVQEGELPEDYPTLDRIRTELDVASPAFAQLVAAGQEATQRSTSLETDLNVAREKLHQAEQAAAALQEEVTGLGQQMEEARGALAAAQASAEEKERQIAQISGRLGEAQTRLTELQADEDVLKGALEQARGELSHSQSELAQRRAEVDDALEQLRSAKQHHADELRQKEEEVSAALDRGRQEAERAKRLTSDLEQERSRAKTEIRKLREEKAATEGRLAARFSEIAVLAGLLADKENEALEFDERAAWLREVSAMLLNGPTGGSIKARIAALLPAQIRLKKQKARLKQKGMFDPDAYLAANPDVAEAGIDPLWHYINHGIAEKRPLNSGRNPA